MVGGWSISCKIVLKWMPMDLTDGKSTLVQVMVWCRQATSHYLNHCWPRSLSPYDVIRPQWVKALRALIHKAQDLSWSVKNEDNLPCPIGTVIRNSCVYHACQTINSLTPGRCGSNCKSVTFEPVLWMKLWTPIIIIIIIMNTYEISVIWMP